MHINRKTFLKEVSLLAGASMISANVLADMMRGTKHDMKLGFVTYLWGKDWDVPTLIKNCTESNIHGVELRVEHAHKVMPELNASQRSEVRKMFEDIMALPTRIVESDRLPSYSKRTMDIEVWNEDKWMEVCSISKRTDFPQKARIAIKDKIIEKDLLVLEIALSSDRVTYNYLKRIEKKEKVESE